MRKLFIVLAVLAPFAAASEDTIKSNTMTVHGDAVIKIAPDLLTLPVTVREENTTLSVAKEKQDEKLRKLLKVAEDLGIPKDKIQTSYTAVNPVYDYDRDSTRPRLRGYQVQTSLEFRLTDFSKLSDFMNGIIAAGIDDIGSVSYSLQDEEKVKNESLSLAMEHAYIKAMRLASAAKVTLDRPLVVEEGGADIQRPMPMMRAMGFAKAMNAGVAPASPELPSGILEVRQSVTVTYALK